MLAAIDTNRIADNAANHMSVFTCSSCAIALPSLDEQRTHYLSELHRYNMKRRVAGLPPISLATFDKNSASLNAGSSTSSHSKPYWCGPCRKSYSTESSYSSHMRSRRHLSAELLAVGPTSSFGFTKTDIHEAVKRAWEHGPLNPSSIPIMNKDIPNVSVDTSNGANVDGGFSPTQCLFCSFRAASMDGNLVHMHDTHSFFIPDAEDLNATSVLLKHLHGQIFRETACIFCNRGFRTSKAAQQHMIDKAHCRIRSHQPDGRVGVLGAHRVIKDKHVTLTGPPVTSLLPGEVLTPTQFANMRGGNLSDGDSGSIPRGHECPANAESFERSIPTNAMSYGDTPFELVLATGKRIGHRSLKHYYAQSWSNPLPQRNDTTSGAALIRQLRADKHTDLVPLKGSLGAFGAGTEVVKARNRGEARNAGSHIREFRDQHRMEKLKTRVGFHNNYIQYWGYPFLE